MSDYSFSHREVRQLLASDFLVTAPPFESQYECREFLADLPADTERLCLVLDEADFLDSEVGRLGQICLIRAASTAFPFRVHTGWLGELRDDRASLSGLHPKQDRRDFDFLLLRQHPDLVEGFEPGEKVNRVFRTCLAAANLWEHVIFLEPFGLLGDDDWQHTEDEAWAALVESADTRGCAWLLSETPEAPERPVAEILRRLGATLLLGSGADTPGGVCDYSHWREWLEHNMEEQTA